MTGYARHEGAHDDLSWVWELRSVNGKGLDVRVRLPAGFEALDSAARARVADALGRGNITVALTVNRDPRAVTPVVNEALLDKIFALRETLADRIDPAPPRLEALLAIRGAIEFEDAPNEAATEDRDRALLDSLDGGLAALKAMRADEGARLATALFAVLDEVASHVAEARTHDDSQPAALRARLEAQVAELLAAQPALPEERLAQEAALLATKADIREELDRLDAHVSAAHALLGEDAPVGRRLEFLCQEFNREANTLCSKASSIELTRIGLALKASIDRMREQVLNIE